MEGRSVQDGMRMAWIEITAVLARGLGEDNGRDIGAILAATWCLALDITVTREGANQQVLIVDQDWDTHTVS